MSKVNLEANKTTFSHLSEILNYLPHLSNEKDKKVHLENLIVQLQELKQTAYCYIAEIQANEKKGFGLEELMSSHNLFGIRETGKLLNIGQNKLVEHLLNEKILYRDANQKLQTYQHSINQKLICVVLSKPKVTAKGERLFSQIKLTPKLLSKIACSL